jgi:hypothetical protein
VKGRGVIRLGTLGHSLIVAAIFTNSYISPFFYMEWEISPGGMLYLMLNVEVVGEVTTSSTGF